MGRLTNHFNYCTFISCPFYNEELAKENKCQYFDLNTERCHEKAVYEKLAHYEDLEEQSLLVRLPFAIGSMLYVAGTKCLANEEPFEDWCDTHDCEECILDKTHTVFETKATAYMIYVIMTKTDKNWIFGKTVFLTKAEAEKALAEMGVMEWEN